MSGPLGARCAAEVAGTALLVGLGTGAIVAGADVGGVPQWMLAIAWFLAVLIPVLAFASVSGSHINPVVTLTLVATGRFPAREAPAYGVSQVIGALVGSLTVRAALGGGASLGATVPHGIGAAELFVLELGFTFALLVTVLVLTRSGGPASRWELALPAVVIGVSTEYIGPLTGSSLNPARSLAPALLSGADADLGVYFAAAFTAAGLATGLLYAWRRGQLARRNDTSSRSAPPPRRSPGERGPAPGEQNRAAASSASTAVPGTGHRIQVRSGTVTAGEPVAHA